MTEEQYNSLKKGDRIYSISRGINSDGTLGDVRVSDIVYHFSHHGTDKCPSITGIGWYRFDVAYIDRSNCGHNGVYAFQKREMLQDGWVIEIDTKNPLTAGNRTSMEDKIKKRAEELGNQSASPLLDKDRADGPLGCVAVGLTKREHFAVMAMQGLLCNPKNDRDSGSTLAEYSVEYADELLIALAKAEMEASNV